MCQTPKNTKSHECKKANRYNNYNVVDCRSITRKREKQVKDGYDSDCGSPDHLGEIRLFRGQFKACRSERDRRIISAGGKATPPERNAPGWIIPKPMLLILTERNERFISWKEKRPNPGSC